MIERGEVLVKKKKPVKVRQQKRRKKRPYFLLLLLAAGGWLFIKNSVPTLSPFDWFNHKDSVVEVAFVREVNQHLEMTQGGMPLILQKDERWYYEAYGTENSNNYMGVNGCALASLAMMGSFWQERYIEPVEILGWAQNNYYLSGQGTTWRIFNDYAHAIGMTSQDLGNDFATAKNFMTLGYPVIVSVKPGYFTEVGHIMVLRADAAGDIVVYDPNDSPDKRHYAQTFSDELLLNESINYWVYQ